MENLDYPICYVYDEKKWADKKNSRYECGEPAVVETYSEAILEPLRKVTDNQEMKQLEMYEGGLCDKDFNFITGLKRKLDTDISFRSCSRSYSLSPDAPIAYRDETVVFGGVLQDGFGHLITETSSRLWYVAQNPGLTEKIVFVLEPHSYEDYPLHQFQIDFLALLGLTEDRYEIIRKPTMFSKVIVPGETSFLLGAIRIINKS